jgi:hypothetical protein
MFIKANNPDSQAGLWFQTLDENRKTLGRHSNVPKEGRQRSDWSEASIVVDIDKQVSDMIFGIYVSGKGKFWLDKVSFEIVAKDTPLTSESHEVTSL